MAGEIGQSIGDKGEKAFADLCNKFDCEFLHISQEPSQYSSKMYQTRQKRPDFLVNIPDITSLFVDVKVREQKPAGNRSQKLVNIKAFSVDYTDFEKMRRLENRIRVSTWYAFFEMKGESDLFRSPAYLVPLSRVEKQLPDHIRKRMAAGNEVKNWPEIRIPIHCMNEWTRNIDLSDKCQGCTERYCSIDLK